MLDTATRLPVRDAVVIDLNYYIQSIVYSPDGSRLAVGSKRQVVLLDAATGKQVGSPLLGARGSVMSVAFGADSRTLAAGSSSGDVEVFDLQNAPLATKVPSGTDSVGAIAFRPDGKILAAAGSDGVVRLWDTTTWQTTGQTPASDKGVSAIAFSPDGKTLASGGADKLVHLWDASTGKQLADTAEPKGRRGLLPGLQPGRQVAGSRRRDQPGIRVGRGRRHAGQDPAVLRVDAGRCFRPDQGHSKRGFHAGFVGLVLHHGGRNDQVRQLGSARGRGRSGRSAS